MRKVKSPLDRQLARHAVDFAVRCDVVLAASCSRRLPQFRS